MAKGDKTVSMGGTKGSGIESLKKALQGRITRKGITKAIQPLTKDVKAQAPVRDEKDIQGGTLKKSIGSKVGFSKKKKTTIGMVGVRTGFRTQVGTVKSGKNAGQPIYANPAHYFHLVEYGTWRSAAKAFARPTMAANKSRTVAIFVATVKDGIQKEAARVRQKKGK